MTDRATFDAWCRTCEGHPFAGQFLTLMWKAWQEAARQERERCLKICDEFSDDYMQQARGGDRSGASDHKACAAVEIADEIRSRSPSPSPSTSQEKT